MFIVDAQVHIWAPDRADRPWRKGQEPHRAEPLGADELLREMDKAGVARAVLISPYWDGPRNDVVLAAARAHPERFAAMGRLDNDPPPQRGEVVRWREQPGMLGLRCSFTRGQASATLEGLDWVWDEAERGNVPLMVLVPHAMMPVIDRIAERHPDLKLVMSHMGLAGHPRDSEPFRELDKLVALAKRPNVAVKASALPVFTNDVYPYRALHPYVRRVYDAFGPKRMFWGTDLARLPCTYRQAVTMFTEEMPWLSDGDKEWIMGRGVCEWLRWELPRSARS
jgi:predicted TIM-barrel fold metal-dependent hydrolase